MKTSADIVYWAGRVLYYNEKDDEARKLIEQALQLDPNHDQSLQFQKQIEQQKEIEA